MALAEKLAETRAAIWPRRDPFAMHSGAFGRSLLLAVLIMRIGH